MSETRKFLDYGGLDHFLTKLKSFFIKKPEGQPGQFLKLNDNYEGEWSNLPSMLTYKGSKATLADVWAITDMQLGDVWSVDNDEYFCKDPSLPASEGRWELLGQIMTTQVQVDWNEADTTSVKYIQNKPTIITYSAGDNVDITNNAISAEGYTYDSIKNSIAEGEGNEYEKTVASGVSSHAEGYGVLCGRDGLEHTEYTYSVWGAVNFHAYAFDASVGRSDIICQELILLGQQGFAIKLDGVNITEHFLIGELSSNNIILVDNPNDPTVNYYFLLEESYVPIDPDTELPKEHITLYVPTTASGLSAHAEGKNTKAKGRNTHTEGLVTIATKDQAHAEGHMTLALGMNSHAEGLETTAVKDQSHAEGYGERFQTGLLIDSRLGDDIFLLTTHVMPSTSVLKVNDCILVNGKYAYVTQINDTASGITITVDNGQSISTDSHPSIYKVTGITYGKYAHSEGRDNAAIGTCSHAEGKDNAAVGENSHAEGQNCVASGHVSHAEGVNTTASYSYAHSEGERTVADGRASHAEGYFTEVYNEGEHAEGSYNISRDGIDDSTTTLSTIGMGSVSQRRNAVEVMKNGDVYIKDVGGYNGVTITGTQTLQQTINGNTPVGSIQLYANSTLPPTGWLNCNGGNIDVTMVSSGEEDFIITINSVDYYVKVTNRDYVQLAKLIKDSYGCRYDSQMHINGLSLPTLTSTAGVIYIIKY